MNTPDDIPNACPNCGGKAIHQVDLKEELVRLAEQRGCHVEMVEHSEDLMYLGGVGCLLRYRSEGLPTG